MKITLTRAPHLRFALGPMNSLGRPGLSCVGSTNICDKMSTWQGVGNRKLINIITQSIPMKTAYKHQNTEQLALVYL